MVERHKAIQHLPNKKAPGPDGYPVEFYKALWQAIAPTYYRMATDIQESGLPSLDMNSANICF